MNERRRWTRVPISCPVKLRDAGDGKYRLAETRNVSTGGALLEMRSPARFNVGQRVRVGISPNRRAVILTDNDFTDATVLRSMGIEGRQSVAVKFDDPLPLAMTA